MSFRCSWWCALKARLGLYLFSRMKISNSMPSHPKSGCLLHSSCEIPVCLGNYTTQRVCPNFAVVVTDGNGLGKAMSADLLKA